MKPKLLIDAKVYRKIRYWIDKAPGEISGLGTVIFDKEALCFRVVSTILLQQKNTSTDTEIDPEAICKALYELRDAPGELRYHWHSHVNMPTFWSGTDKEMLRQIGGHGWVVASVFNKKNEFKSAYYSTQHELFPIFLDDLETTTADAGDDTKAWDIEYEANVKKWVPTYPTRGVTVWNPQLKAWVSPGSNTIGIGTTSGNCYSEEAKREALLLNRRPIGMTKREWKKLKADNRERMLKEAEAEKAEDEQLSLLEKSFVDPYPFTQAELDRFAGWGIDLIEIDYMLNKGYSREEMIQLIDTTVGSLQTDNVSPEELIDDDVPVADRRHRYDDISE